MDLGKDLVAASATPLVLAILAEGESYGYAIIKRVSELSAELAPIQLKGHARSSATASSRQSGDRRRAAAAGSTTG